MTEVHHTWHRGEHCFFGPSKNQLAEKNAIRKFILPGWLPDEPFITEDMLLTTFGSCFAEHITRYLVGKMKKAPSSDRRYCDARVVRYGEGMVNTWSVMDQFIQAFTRRRVSPAHDKRGRVILPTKKETQAAQWLFRDTDIFVITLGLAEVWENFVTGEVLWRGVPSTEFDPSIHRFRLSTVEENYSNLHRIVKLMRRHNPTARVIFTLSPVPLVATFRPVSCVTANSVSKATLRVAVDQLMRNDAGPDLFYWPSYEIVKEYFGNDAYEGDNRHIRADVIETIMKEFVRAYFVPQGT